MAPHSERRGRKLSGSSHSAIGNPFTLPLKYANLPVPAFRGKELRMALDRTPILALLVGGVALAASGGRAANADSALLESTHDSAAYAVALDVSQSGGGATWRYTITSTTKDAKDLGNFIINFGNCGDQSPTIASIVSATVNGVSWLDQIDATEGRTGAASNPGISSSSTILPEADAYVIEFTLERRLSDRGGRLAG